MPEQRIISLLPSATEILFALGAGPHVVGVTHECDHPTGVLNLPKCTASLLAPNLTAREIDEAVRKSLTDDPHTIYRLDVERVRCLQPTVIVTQSLCAVCAVPEDTVRATACTLPACHVMSSDPHTLDEMFESVLNIGRAIGHDGTILVKGLRERVERVRSGVGSSVKKNVFVLEWPDPPFAPGHWVPDMIEAAGGICAVGKSGEKSRRMGWDEVDGLEVDVVICAFCGYGLKQNEAEMEKMEDVAGWDKLKQSAEIYATDASAYFSRPGVRLVEGVELLSFILGNRDFRPPSGRGSVWRGQAWVDLADVE